MNLPFSQARWTWTADLGHPNYGVRRFRITLESAEAQMLRLHVSADSRYLLFFDGERDGMRPCPVGRPPLRLRDL